MCDFRKAPIMNTREEILAQIDQMDNVCIIVHTDPDGDALGSAYGLKCELEKRGEKAEVMTPYEFQKRFAWQEGTKIAEKPPENIMRVLHKGQSTQIDKPDFIIAVDCADMDRFDYFKERFQKATEQGKTMQFDHHKNNPCYASYNYVKQVSSCGEVLCQVFYNKDTLTKDVAFNWFLAIMSDTQSFDIPCEAETYLWAGRMREGISAYDKLKIKRALKSKSIIKFRLFGYIGSTAIERMPGVWTACISRDVLDKFDAKMSDTIGLVNEMLKIDGSKLAVLLKEQRIIEDGKDKFFYKVSMRSNSDDPDGVSAYNICSQFGGGGHDGASGCDIYESDINKVYETLEPAIKKELNKS